LENVCAYLFKVTDAVLRFPWLGSKAPQEDFPIVLAPDRSITLTWIVDFPKSLQLGECAGSIDLGIVAPTHDGWGRRGQETKPFTLVVEEQDVVVPTATAITLATVHQSVTTSGRYVLWVLIHEVRGRTTTEVMWTMSTIGVPDPASTASQGLFLIGLPALAILFGYLVYRQTRTRRKPIKLAAGRP
jgi:hypothetical protein